MSDMREKVREIALVLWKEGNTSVFDDTATKAVDQNTDRILALFEEEKLKVISDEKGVGMSAIQSLLDERAEVVKKIEALPVLGFGMDKLRRADVLNILKNGGK